MGLFAQISGNRPNTLGMAGNDKKGRYIDKSKVVTGVNYGVASLSSW